MPRRSEPWVLLAVGLAGLALSAVHPHDRTTWYLEVAPILIGAPLLIATGRRFPLTPLLYRLIFVHAIILMVGGALALIMGVIQNAQRQRHTTVTERRGGPDVVERRDDAY